jgi:hypothetical protein
MLDGQAIQLMHLHADGRSAPMTLDDPHDPAQPDEERDWLRGGRIFRCTECSEQVVIGSPRAGAGEPGGPA